MASQRQRSHALRMVAGLSYRPARFHRMDIRQRAGGEHHSMTKHTPGPWTYSRWDESRGTSFYIAQADGAPYTPNYSDVATLVAETCIGEQVSIQEANARLIAAAPELLKALESFPGFLCGTQSGDAWIEQLRAAIAKARGEA